MKIHVKKSISIAAPLSKVQATLTDFHTWGQWSPWLVAEPDAKVTIPPEGTSYSWEGDLVGAGKMAFNSINEDAIEIDLNFFKPWKSKAKVAFQLEQEDNVTTVHWTMDSKLPFFLFWMKKSMTAYIGMDYERGLAMLKDFIELGTVPFNIKIDGIQMQKAVSYVGKHGRCSLEEVGQQVSEDFQNLMPYLHQNHKSLLIDAAFTIYSKWDVVRGEVAYTLGHPVAALPDELAPPYHTGTLSGGKMHSVTYTGPYRHIGNAWAVQMMYAQNKRFKSHKKIPPFEKYHNSPVNTPENDLITQVLFPVK